MGRGTAAGAPRRVLTKFLFDPELAGELLDVPPLIGRQQRDPDALSTGAAGATNPVHVGLTVGGRIEVDHVRDVVDVDPARRDIGRDEDVDRTRFKAGKSLLALAL